MVQGGVTERRRGTWPPCFTQHPRTRRHIKRLGSQHVYGISLIRFGTASTPFRYVGLFCIVVTTLLAARFFKTKTHSGNDLPCPPSTPPCGTLLSRPRRCTTVPLHSLPYIPVLSFLRRWLGLTSSRAAPSPVRSLPPLPCVFVSPTACLTHSFHLCPSLGALRGVGFTSAYRGHAVALRGMTGGVILPLAAC